MTATGITAYMEVGGTLENAQAMAAHESPRTTKLYDRTSDASPLDEVERIINERPRASGRLLRPHQHRRVAVEVREHLLQMRDLRQIVLDDIRLSRVQERVVLMVVLRRVERLQR